MKKRSTSDHLVDGGAGRGGGGQDDAAERRRARDAVHVGQQSDARIAQNDGHDLPPPHPKENEIEIDVVIQTELDCDWMVSVRAVRRTDRAG